MICSPNLIILLLRVLHGYRHISLLGIDWEYTNWKEAIMIEQMNTVEVETCCKYTCCADGCCSDGCKTGECSSTCCSDGCCDESDNCC